MIEHTCAICQDTNPHIEKLRVEGESGNYVCANIFDCGVRSGTLPVKDKDSAVQALGVGCTFRPQATTYVQRIRTSHFVIEFPMPYHVESGKTYTVLRDWDGKVKILEGAKMPPGYSKLRRYTAPHRHA